MAGAGYTLLGDLLQEMPCATNRLTPFLSLFQNHHAAFLVPPILSSSQHLPIRMIRDQTSKVFIANAELCRLQSDRGHLKYIVTALRVTGEL